MPLYFHQNASGNLTCLPIFQVTQETLYGKKILLAVRWDTSILREKHYEKLERTIQEIRRLWETFGEEHEWNIE